MFPSMLGEAEGLGETLKHCIMSSLSRGKMSSLAFLHFLMVHSYLWIILNITLIATKEIFYLIQLKYELHSQARYLPMEASSHSRRSYADQFKIYDITMQKDFYTFYCLTIRFPFTNRSKASMTAIWWITTLWQLKLNSAFRDYRKLIFHPVSKLIFSFNVLDVSNLRYQSLLVDQ